MRSILVPVEECAGMHAQLVLAALVAQKFVAHIDGIAPYKVLDTYTIGNGVVGVSAEALERFERDQEDAIAKAHKDFRGFMRDSKIAWEDPLNVTDHATANWLEEQKGGDQAIGLLARLYDVTVLARPVTNESMPRGQLLETVLFESGRPILIAPPKAPKDIGKKVLIAWNGSTESARAITFARPFLHRSELVVVLTVEGGMVAGPGAQAVERALLQAGIPAKASHVQPAQRSIGEAILSEAENMDADLVIKGAYTHSRLRQMIFGGATKHILAEADIPVLMAH